MRNNRLMLCTLLGVVYFGSSQADPASPPPAVALSAPADGVWTENKYAFTHLGFTSTYSCDGLADKLKKLLIYSGARADVVASPAACSEGFGRPSKLARVDLKFYTLKPAGTAAPATPASAAAPVVAGAWQAVQFSQLKPRELDSGDCELVEEFRDLLLPMFAARNVQSRLTCIPHQVSGGSLSLSFESFVALPQPQPAGTH